MIVRTRDALPITDEPKEHLTTWRIILLADGDRHFRGIRANGSTVRVSSKIVLYDAEGKTGMTLSGRIYQLEGPPGDLARLGFALAVWCVNNGVDPAEAEMQDEQPL